jgi:branched-chain amino acid aminotransferase
LAPVVPVDEWIGLAKEGASKFGANPQLYPRPFYWAEAAGFSTIVPGAETTRWCLCIDETPMAKTTNGLSITLSPYR